MSTLPSYLKYRQWLLGRQPRARVKCSLTKAQTQRKQQSKVARKARRINRA